MDPTPEAPPRAPGLSRSRKQLLAVGLLASLVVAGIVGVALTRTNTPWQRSGPPATVSAWAPYWQPEAAYASFSANSDVFADLSLFAYHATAVDSVTAYDGLDSNVPALFKETARQSGVNLTASIIDDTSAGTMAAILADPATRTQHVETITRFAADGGFDGIDLDYEKFAFSDGRSTWEATRPNWVAFVTELAEALHADGRTLTVSVPPVYDGDRTSDSGYWVYDYEAMGKVVDAIRIMAYDYSTSEPGPIAPIDWVRELVGAAKDLVPESKLILGVPMYGYDWPATISGTCPADQQPKRRPLSTRGAAELAATHGITPTWVESAAERTFTYIEQVSGNDASGSPTTCVVDHVVWYADAQAIHDRSWLAEREGLAGVALWSLGNDDALVWEGIDAARADIATWPTVVPTSSTDSTTSLAASTTAVGTVAPPALQPSP